MKIAVVMPGYHLLLEDFLKNLSKFHEITLYIPKAEVLKEERPYEISFFSSIGHVDYPIPYGLLLKLRRKEYDLIVTGEDFQLTTFVVGLFCKVNNIPFILIQEKYFISRKKLLSVFHKIMLKSISPFVWRGASKIIAHSNAARAFLTDNGANYNKIIHLPLGIDTNRFHPDRKENHDQIKLISVARLTDHKGLDSLLKAIRILKDQNQNVDLTIVGDGPLKKELKNLAASLKIENDVKFIDHVPYRDIPSEYQKADLFVLVSVIEVYGMAVLEAKSSGLPAILTRIGGLADLIEEGHDGYFVNERDAQSIANAIERCSIDDILEMMQKRAREQALIKYDWDVVAKLYSDEIIMAGKK